MELGGAAFPSALSWSSAAIACNRRDGHLFSWTCAGTFPSSPPKIAISGHLGKQARSGNHRAWFSHWHEAGTFGSDRANAGDPVLDHGNVEAASIEADCIGSNDQGWCLARRLDLPP